MQYLWLTDLHLNFLSIAKRDAFYNELKSQHSDGIIISGDISTGSHIIYHLSELAKIGVPVFFVLGNHDFWNSTTTSVRDRIKQLSHPNLIYLSTADYPVTLAPGVGVIGHDGFCDGRWREPKFPFIFLLDWFFIFDFQKCETIAQKYSLMRDWAYQAAEHISKKIQYAFTKEALDELIIVTHFPLIPEGDLGNWQRFWAPYNSSKVMYETVINVMKDFPKKKLTILSGHTHFARKVFLADNIELKVGAASLGFPAIQETFNFANYSA